MMDSATHSVRRTKICLLGSGVGRLRGAASESLLALLRKGVSSSPSKSSSSNVVRDLEGNHSSKHGDKCVFGETRSQMLLNRMEDGKYHIDIPAGSSHNLNTLS